MSTTAWLLIVLAAFLVGILLGAGLVVKFGRKMEASGP